MEVTADVELYLEDMGILGPLSVRASERLTPDLAHLGVPPSGFYEEIPQKNFLSGVPVELF